MEILKFIIAVFLTGMMFYCWLIFVLGNKNKNSTLWYGLAVIVILDTLTKMQ